MSRSVLYLFCLLSSCLLATFSGLDSVVSAQETSEPDSTFEVRKFEPADAGKLAG